MEVQGHRPAFVSIISLVEIGYTIVFVINSHRHLRQAAPLNFGHLALLYFGVDKAGRTDFSTAWRDTSAWFRFCSASNLNIHSETFSISSPPSCATKLEALFSLVNSTKAELRFGIFCNVFVVRLRLFSILITKRSTSFVHFLRFCPSGFQRFSRRINRLKLPIKIKTCNFHWTKIVTRQRLTNPKPFRKGSPCSLS